MKRIGPPSSPSLIRSRTVAKPDLTVHSPEDGIAIWNHRDVLSFFTNTALKVTPQSQIAIFLPCAVEKPYCVSQSHRTYFYAMRDLLDDLDLYVLSEPMTIVPYQHCDEYPVACYDFPPKPTILTDTSDKIFRSRLSTWLGIFLPHYEQRIIIYRDSSAGMHYKEIFTGSVGQSGAVNQGFDEIICREYSDEESRRIRCGLRDILGK